MSAPPTGPPRPDHEDAAPDAPPVVFVARDTYRRRRMIDAAGLLPVLGALLFALPLLWPGQGGGAARTSHVMIYLFVVWALLVLLSAVITRHLRTGPDALPPADGIDGDAQTTPTRPATSARRASRRC